MFSHPALLRELNQTAEFLRRSGEAQGSRRVARAADELRRDGWTEAGADSVRALWRPGSGLDKLVFGGEPGRGLERAAEQWAAHRSRLERLLELPTRAAGLGREARSPDLF